MSSNTTPSLNHRKLISGALTRTELKTQLYHYDKLEGSNDIRLVVLPPGSFYSSVRCDIIHVDLAEAPDYEALSYTWAGEDGDKSLTGAILCGPDDQRIPITRNCEAALRHLRLEREARVLWIDAICINQTTLQERNHQVSIMSKIYSTASRVVVYLGEATRESDEFINYLNRRIDAPFKSAVIRQANAMLRRGWFTRLWVFQEIMLARHAVVMCGDKTVPWQTLVNFYDRYICRTSIPIDQQAKLHKDTFAQILFHYGLTGAQPIETLPKLFYATQDGKASDPRDKVFALLGIVEKDSNPQMVPDYGLSRKEAFEDLAAYLVRRFGIVFPSFGSEGSSWVFDWLNDTPQTPIHIGDESFSQDTIEGGKRLFVRGQRVIRGFTKLHQRRDWNMRAINPNDTIISAESFGSQNGELLVRVSEHYCVLLRARYDLYKIVGEAGALQQCEFHGNDSQCRPNCFRREITIDDREDFEII